MVKAYGRRGGARNIESLTVRDLLDAGIVDADKVSTPTLSAESGSLTDLSVTNAPYLAGESDNLSEEHGRTGSVTVSAASDNTTDTYQTNTTSVTYDAAFDADPQVFPTVASNTPELRAYPINESTTGFDILVVNFSTTQASSDVRWWAIGPR